MRKTETIQAGFQDRRTEIPAGIDAFLQMLARWTVEDMQTRPAYPAENKGFEEIK